ncbi:hypothetical protein HZB93_02105 [Candidatus Falkowbacteria bacterium]|nr:hypothetical protein [Candidatus Falkowbacteria bacterium]
MRSVYDGVKALAAVRPVAADAAATAIAIDTLGYNSAMFVVKNGAATGTPTSYTVDGKVQECATSGGSYADVSGAVITQITADNKSAQIRVEGLGTSRLRYLKLIITPAMTGGTSPKALISGTALLGRAYKNPVGNSATGA